MEAISLYELNEHVKRIVALNFPQAVWVKAEISQINFSKGHFYLELLEKDPLTEDVTAVASGILWSKTYRKLREELGRGLDQVLRQGQEVQLKVRPDFSERYGFKLMLEEVDVSFTLGEMELQRQAVLEELKKKRLLHKNRFLELPKVLQRIAIISSPRAAGLQDFLQQIADNAYGYTFENHLFEAAMQGQYLEKEVSQKLELIASRAKDFDVVVLIRGGGSRLDLSGFDSLALGKAIANCPLPVFTGIGHDVDETVADLVAHQRLKTPTAVASFIVQNNQHFEAAILQKGNAIAQFVRNKIHEAQMNLERFRQGIYIKSRQQVSDASYQIESLSEQINKEVPIFIKMENNKLGHMEQLMDLYSIEKTLERGYALLSAKGKVLGAGEELSLGDVLDIETENMKYSSRVEQKNKK